MRTLARLLVTAVALQGLAPAPALAQSSRYDQGSRYAGGLDRDAAEACTPAVRGEVQARFPQAYGVRLAPAETVPVGRDQTQVNGSGEFDDRNGGAARFTYACTYNDRTGATFALDVRDVRPVSDGKKAGKKDNSAAIAGLVLGAIIVGAAVAASSDKDKDRDRYRDDGYRRSRRGDFSPEPGVTCNAREAACYKEGRYSEKWTRRVFVQ